MAQEVADMAAQRFPNAMALSGSETPSPGAIGERKVGSIVRTLTVNLVPTMVRINPGFKVEQRKPGRLLTQPSTPARNGGLDNAEGNLICRVNDCIRSESHSTEYVVLDLLGQGTFGQVFRCQEMPSRRFVAVKVVKNKPAYTAQAHCEIKIAAMLTNLQRRQPESDSRTVKLLHHFAFSGHLCLVFEELGTNLYEVLKNSQFRGLPLAVVRTYITQILQALVCLQQHFIIHCDLKPENILLDLAASAAPPEGAAEAGRASPRPRPLQAFRGSAFGSMGDIANATSARDDLLSGAKNGMLGGGGRGRRRRRHQGAQGVRVIDFGSACFEGQTMYSYIQSRFYRSPEVLLGLPYNGAIDMWSFGCICAELFLGLPILPGSSEHNQLSRIVTMFGAPPRYMLLAGKHTKKFFHSKRVLNDAQRFTLKTAEEFATAQGKPVAESKRYFRYDSLTDILVKYPFRRNMTAQDMEREKQARLVFAHFCAGLLRIDPRERYTAKQALQHPFITGEPLTEAFRPAPDPRIVDSAVREAMRSDMEAAGNGQHHPEQPLKRSSSKTEAGFSQPIPVPRDQLSQRVPKPHLMAFSESNANAAPMLAPMHPADVPGAVHPAFIIGAMAPNPAPPQAPPLPNLHTPPSFPSGAPPDATPPFARFAQPQAAAQSASLGGGGFAYSYGAPGQLVGMSDFGFALGHRPERPSPGAPLGAATPQQPFLFGSSGAPAGALLTTPERLTRRQTTAGAHRRHHPSQQRHRHAAVQQAFQQETPEDAPAAGAQLPPGPLKPPPGAGSGFAGPQSMPEDSTLAQHMDAARRWAPAGAAQTEAIAIPAAAQRRAPAAAAPPRERAGALVVGPGHALRKRHSMPVDMGGLGVGGEGTPGGSAGLSPMGFSPMGFSPMSPMGSFGLPIAAHSAGGGMAAFSPPGGGGIALQAPFHQAGQAQVQQMHVQQRHMQMQQMQHMQHMQQMQMQQMQMQQQGAPMAARVPFQQGRAASPLPRGEEKGAGVIMEDVKKADTDDSAGWDPWFSG